MSAERVFHLSARQAMESFPEEARVGVVKRHYLSGGRYDPLHRGRKNEQMVPLDVWSNGMVTAKGEDPKKVAIAYVDACLEAVEHDISDLQLFILMIRYGRLISAERGWKNRTKFLLFVDKYGPLLPILEQARRHDLLDLPFLDEGGENEETSTSVVQGDAF